MKTYKWTQTIIDFETYHKSKIEIEYHKTYNSTMRFYKLYSLVNFKKKSHKKWFSDERRITNKINEKEAIHKYIRKLWIAL